MHRDLAPEFEQRGFVASALEPDQNADLTEAVSNFGVNIIGNNTVFDRECRRASHAHVFANRCDHLFENGVDGFFLAGIVGG